MPLIKQETTINLINLSRNMKLRKLLPYFFSIGLGATAAAVHAINTTIQFKF